MSEYSYQKVSQDEFVIYAPDGRVVGKEVFKALAQDKVEILNAETAPLLARIAELELSLRYIQAISAGAGLRNPDFAYGNIFAEIDKALKKAGDNG